MKLIKRISLVVAGVLLAMAAVEVFSRGLPLFWKMRHRFCGPGNPPAVTIYVIGESTSFGEPYGPAISFPKIVSYMFGGRIAGKTIRIKNLAVAGSTMEAQYWRLFRELSRQCDRNGVLFIYAGINDRLTADKPGWDKFLSRHSIIYSRLACMNRGKGGQAGDYEGSLRKAVELAQDYGIEVIVSNLVGNFTEFAPKDNRIFGKEENRELLQKADACESAGDLDKAKELYNRILVLNPGADNAYAWYRLGGLYRKQKEYAAAREAYYRASDSGGKRPTMKQNRMIREIAGEYKARFVDTFSRFERNAANGLIGYNLCGDAHHPNLEGYILLAGGFAEALGNLYGVKPDRTDVSAKELMEYFRFGEAELFGVYMHNLKWLVAEAKDDVYRKESVDRAGYYLEEARLNYGRNPTGAKKAQLALASLMMATISNDGEGVVRWLKEGEFLSKNRGMIETKNDFFTAWLKDMICTVDLPEDIREALRIDKARYERMRRESASAYTIVS